MCQWEMQVSAVSPSKHASAEEVAWAAGFFDAEGCYSYSEAGRFASLSIGQTERGPLDRFARAVGTGRVAGPIVMKSPIRPSVQPQFRFYIYRAEELRRVAALLWPHLGELKRRQVDGVLARLIGTRLDPSEFEARSSPAERAPRMDLAWAAGFFDGEGSFSLGTNGYPCVAITQKHQEVLERFAGVLEMGKLYGPYRHRTATLSREPFFLYRASGFERVQAVVAKLWFCLGATKRRQAKRVLQHYPRTCRRGHPKRPGHNGCGTCTAEYWQRRRERVHGPETQEPHLPPSPSARPFGDRPRSVVGPFGFFGPTGQ
jgi:hypothetical protein